MADKENFPPASPTRSTPTPTALGLRPWHMSPFASPPLRAISPNSKPMLNRQRDHSACGRGDTPLRVRKTRENLRTPYPDIPPPCLHDTAASDDMLAAHSTTADISGRLSAVPTPSAIFDAAIQDATLLPAPPELLPPRMQRHKSVSRRMLTRVKQGISNRAKATISTRPMESETSLIRRFSGKRKQSGDTENRATSFEVSRASIVSTPEEDIDVAYTVPYGGVRSFADSTESTSGIIEEVFCPSVTAPLTTPVSTTRTGPDVASAPLAEASLGFTEPTPRPYGREGYHMQPVPSSVSIPFIELAVSLEHATVDATTSQDVWVALEATVCSQTMPVIHSPALERMSSLSEQHADAENGCSDPGLIGTVTSLRLCFKPVRGCCLVEAVGQKAAKDLTVGQKASLFVRVRVPEVPSETGLENADHDAMMMELESIVGTLETELLHVEARYRSSLLPQSNVVTVRHIAKIRRPRSESRWSLIGVYQDMETAEQMHTKLAIHIADHYPASKALKLIDRFLSTEAQQDEPVRQIRQTVADEIAHQEEAELGAAREGPDRPSVVVTDNDADVQAMNPAQFPEHYDTAPCTPTGGAHKATSPLTMLDAPTLHAKYRSVSLSAMTLTAELGRPSASTSTTEADDAARQVWHHIRRSSLSAKQLAERTTQQIQKLEAGDVSLEELRKKALANKRSVGAETLKDWKWEANSKRMGEAPWL